MKNTTKQLKRIAGVAFFCVALGACQDDDQQFTADQAKEQSTITAENNNDIIATTQSAMEITSDVFETEGISSGRASSGREITNGRHGGHDSHGCDPSISGSFDLDRSQEGVITYTGSLTVDYGDGSSCDSDHVLKGKVTDDFSYTVSFNDSLTFTSTETITFDGFSKDSVQLDGTFIIKWSTGNPKTVEAKDAKITYPDGTTVTWSGILSYEYDLGKICHWKDNVIHVTGIITGTNREGNAFSWKIIDPLIYKYHCGGKHHRYFPVGGSVELTAGGIVSVIDYGDGNNCDKNYSITVNGETTEFTFHIGDD